MVFLLEKESDLRDNPHTKPFDFWQWLISEVRERYPDVIFLSAFTRPKVMYRLAKLDFPVLYLFHLAKYQGRANRVL